MNIGELKKKLQKTKLSDDEDVSIMCDGKRYGISYASKRNYPRRDTLFTGRIFEIVCKDMGVKHEKINMPD